jgi:hypothetical protein
VATVDTLWEEGELASWLPEVDDFEADVEGNWWFSLVVVFS